MEKGLIHMKHNGKRLLYDELTGVYSRYGMKRKMEEVCGYTRSVVLLLINIKRFKWINKTMGHHVGDEVLRSVAKRLRKSIPNGTISRQWGDEFAVLLSDMKSEKQIRTLVESLMRTLQHPFFVRNYKIALQCYIGGVIAKSSEVQDMLKDGETALLCAKEKGKDICFFCPRMRAALHSKIEVAFELQQALPNQELALYYQPQVNIATGEVGGVEALMRWQHPKKGLILPGEFISIAEETDLIIPIGKWVIYEACRQNKEWREQGSYNGKISINISPKQFMQDDFVIYVQEVLARTKLDPSDIELEITESLYLEEGIYSKLEQLRQLGVQLSIDDFGTGYASFQYLKRCPVHAVKIAPQFVMNMDKEEPNKSIISLITALAEELQLQTIAEGVETKEQLSFLESLNCAYVQGYFFSPPLPPEELISFLKS
jgi:diguanylate cyclase (GGDEF)-like protein